MGIQLEQDFQCIESNVATLMRKVRTPMSLADLQNEEYRDSRELDIIDRSLIVSSMRWGTVYGYEKEQGGIPVQNLFPIKKNENEQISSSSKVDLEMHTETAFHPLRPDYLFLLCVREDPSAGTVYVLLEDILEELSDSVIVLLHLPVYYTRIDKSFLEDGQEDKEIQTSILFDSATRIVYDRALMGSRTKVGQDALKSLSKAIDRCKRTVYLKTGDLLVIENKNTIHGRTAFSPRYDGTDRWIKRAMVLSREVSSDYYRRNTLGTRTITLKL